MVLRAIDSVRDSVLNASGSTPLLPVTVATSPVPSIRHSESIIPTIELVLGTITYLVIIMMTIGGNTLVVVAVFSYRPLKKVQNYFLVSLAASDLCVAIFVMPLHVVKFLADGRWLLGIVVCQFFTTADILLCTSSILNLCAIAIDRYCAIHDPINYAQKRTPKFVCMVILIVWLLSILISVPPLIGWNDWNTQKLKDHCELSSEKAFVVFSASGSFFLPLLVMIIVYVKIFLSARQRIRTNRGRSALMRIQNAEGEEPPTTPGPESRMSLKRGSVESCRTSSRIGERTPLVVADSMTTATTTILPSPSPFTKTTADGNGAQTPHEETTTKNMKYAHNGHSGSMKSQKDDQSNPTAVLRKREKISVAKEKRAAKTIAVIIFVFTFCWLPFFCAYVILPFCSSCSLHPKVNQAFTWLGYINSSLNPFLYGILNLEFRRAFKKILCPKAVLDQRRRRLSGNNN
ncbi:hypothetical protein WR25_14883 [Diploscapter pachys]|uniref:G-protein coupled receptors family 1 profile domain-containing protein n=1 Tax=Diploscapter pachys TaxID=2018661 RepID=A0A2A2LV30_9BILA|nr:hypothetical protein WR25_14883 [Diploscapter pachys]